MALRAHEYPSVGTWYWDLDHADRFEIIAKDDKSNQIEVQYFSGELEEMDMETWFSLRVVSINPPQDNPDAYDEMSDMFSDLEEKPFHPWHDPLEPYEDE